jgi:predicted amidohydrolase YtcJ
VLGADQRITREEALRVSTINNAYLMFEESSKGSIEVGKLVDLVVLAIDYLISPPYVDPTRERHDGAVARSRQLFPHPDS